MSEKEYSDLTKLVEDLKEICSVIVAGGKRLAEGMKDFKDRLKRFFVFIRLSVKKDFKSNTGMSFDEWIEFGNKLSKLFEDILNAVWKVYDCRSESDFGKIPETLNELNCAATPFINDYNSIIDSLTKLQKYSAEMATGIKSVPSVILGDEEKQAIGEESSRNAADLKKLIEALSGAKAKILTVKNFKK